MRGLWSSLYTFLIMFFHPLNVGGTFDFGSINIDLLFFARLFRGMVGVRKKILTTPRKAVITYIIIKFYL